MQTKILQNEDAEQQWKSHHSTQQLGLVGAQSCCFRFNQRKIPEQSTQVIVCHLPHFERIGRRLLQLNPTVFETRIENPRNVEKRFSQALPLDPESSRDLTRGLALNLSPFEIRPVSETLQNCRNPRYAPAPNVDIDPHTPLGRGDIDRLDTG